MSLNEIKNINGILNDLEDMNREMRVSIPSKFRKPCRRRSVDNGLAKIQWKQGNNKREGFVYRWHLIYLNIIEFHFSSTKNRIHFIFPFKS